MRILPIGRHLLSKIWMKSSINTGMKSSGKILFRSGCFKTMEKEARKMTRETLKMRMAKEEIMARIMILMVLLILR